MTSVSDDTGGWSKAEQRVNYQLADLKDALEKLQGKVDQIGTDIVAIKTEQRVRGGMFGAAGGLLAAGLLKLAEVFAGK